MYPELRKYHTHTEVQAVRIRSVRMTNEGYSLQPFDDDIPNFNAPDLRGTPAPGGYFVLFPNGSTMFLSQEAFESSYSLADDLVNTQA